MFEKLRENKTLNYTYNIVRTIFWIMVVVCFIFSPTAIIEFINGKSLNKVFEELIEFTKFFGGYILAILIITTPIALIANLMGSALKNKKGKAYQIVEIINGICLIFLCLVGAYFVLYDIVKLFKESILMFIAVACATSFSVYYWFKKKNRFEKKNYFDDYE